MPVGAGDRVIATFLLIVCATVGFAVAARTRIAQPTNRVPDVNKRILAASLMASCGRGWSTPVALSPSTEAFVNGERDAVSCAEVAKLAPAELDDFQRSSRYLIATVAGAWLITGPSWRAVDGLLGVWFAITMLLAYATCRLVSGKWTSLAVTVLLVTSPLHLRALGDLRDYSKAPIFLAAFWLVALVTLRAPSSSNRVVALAALAGVVAGFGYGMRTDNIITLPLMLIAITLFWPAPVFTSWRRRGLAVVTCAAVFFLLALPVASAANRGGVAAHWAILGLGSDFDRTLRVIPGPYRLGTPYDDSVVASIVQAHAERRLGVRQTVFMGTPPYTAASTAYYREVLTHFPADMIARAAGAMRRTLDLPFLSDSTVPATQLSFVARWRTTVLSRLDGIGFLGLTAVVLGTSLYSLKRAFLIASLAVALCAYPFVQYQARHVFQLEFVPLFLVALVGGWWFGPRRDEAHSIWRRESAARALIFALTMLGAGTAILWGSRVIQTRRVTSLFESYENAAVVPLTGPLPAAGSWVSILERDGLRGGAEPQESVSSDMLVLDVGGALCHSERVKIRLTFVPTFLGTAFNRELEVPLLGPNPLSRVFQPVFETGAKNPDPELLRLQRIETPADLVPCVRRVAKFATVAPFPLLLPAVLTADWRNHPVYQRLSR